MLKAINDHVVEGKPFKGIPQSFHLTRDAALKKMGDIPIASLRPGTSFHVRMDGTGRLYELACFEPDAEEHVAVWIISDVMKGSHGWEGHGMLVREEGEILR